MYVLLLFLFYDGVNYRGDRKQENQGEGWKMKKEMVLFFWYLELLEKCNIQRMVIINSLVTAT